MHPVLFRLGPLVLPTYGAAIAAGFFLFTMLAARGARRQGIVIDRVLDLSFWMLGGAALISRLLYVATNPGEFYHRCVTGAPGRGAGGVVLDCLSPLYVWEGGLVYYGGLLGAAGAFFWYTGRHGMPRLKVADLLAPGLALAHLLGRLGCWAAGCCYGRATDGVLGIRLPRISLAYEELLQRGLLSPAALTTPPLHPTQLYEALAEICIFGLLQWVAHRRRRYGEVLLAYLFLYSLVRLVLEVFRGDPTRGYLFSLALPAVSRALGMAPEAPLLLSTSQALAILVAAGTGVIWLRLRRGGAPRLV
jgi:phosphatidylglycerol:prolipoprotein diacylglycerol transferase